MEFENKEQPKNERPTSTDNKPKMILIGLAVALIVLLLYAYFSSSDTDTAKTSDLDSITNQDTASTATAVTPPVVVSAPAVTSTPVAAGPTSEAVMPVVEVPTRNNTTATAPSSEPVEATKPLPVKKFDIGNLKGESRTHIVQVGETFNGIANRYNLKVSTLQALNPSVSPNGVKVGSTKLNVKVQGTHTVGAGDILRVVAKKYGVSVEQLMEVNKKKKNVSTRGEELIIPIAVRQ